MAINKSLSKRRKNLIKEKKKRGDAKANEINETLSNAKMLKLYGWQDEF